MSYTSMYLCTEDLALQQRVIAAAMKEGHSNPQFGDTDFGRALILNPHIAVNVFSWPTAIDYEDEYSYALDEGNANPGGDVGVISDANLEAVVQANWPPEWPPGQGNP